METPSDRARARVVLVTGAGKGLGRAFAEACAAQGARVVVNNRRTPGEPVAADATADAIRARGGEAVAEYSDVRDPEAPGRMVGRALETWGRLDAVILNAGINGAAAKVDTLDPVALREVMETNFFANLGLVQAALPHLKRSAAGRLVFVASTAGLYGVRGRAPYAASKAALIALAHSLADELRKDPVAVNVLAPYAATRMTAETVGTPVGDIFSPDAAAPMAAWLASEACEVRGQVWIAGGGHFARARMEEGAGLGVTPGETASLDWISENIARLGDMTNGRGFSGAEAAFADLAGRVMARAGQEPVA